MSTKILMNFFTFSLQAYKFTGGDEEEKSQPINTELPSNSTAPPSFSTNPSDNKIWRGSKVWTDEELEIFYDLLSEVRV